ncbi:MAG TPA: DUF2306 domain-containing protein [Steroidobacteraceae bacterium]|nr:DUF2306 domain-containing protein [Steroidobacteraceae bacterium]
MNAVAPAGRARESHFGLLFVLAVLAVALLWFALQKAHYLTDYSLASYSDYLWPRRAGLVPHLLGGALAITTGLVQIWLGLTGRVATLHHVLGRLYAAGVLTGSIGGFYLALTIPAPMPYAAGLFMLCVAWVLTTGMALYCVRTGRIEQHREWMLRSYTVTFAFVTYRLVAYWLRRWLNTPEGDLADNIDTLLAWGCWAVPLLIAEPLIQLRRMRRGGRVVSA